MDGWQERVVAEKAELDVKLGRLRDFVGSAGFNSLDFEVRDLLSRQHDLMAKYSHILGERIALFRK